MTRLVRRTGRVLTGVDRVEWAYLNWCIDLDRPVFGLVRSALGYLVLDREGLRVLRQHQRAATWPKSGLLSRIVPGLSDERRRAESTLRKVAIGRALPQGLSRLLRRVLPESTVYLNTGHSNLTERVFQAWKTLEAGKSVVLVHDVIPLTHPEFQRDGTVQSFAKKMSLVSRYADGVICNSNETRKAVEANFERMPDAVVAHLGVAPPSVTETPPRVPDPYVITIGTIEPRKNHALLLDVWETWAEDTRLPHLVICGPRGWKSEATLARLDALKASGVPISEFNDLSDADMFALVKNANAALFPSLVEGFGLPQIEAAQLEVPLICGDLAIYRETLGDFPVYVDVSDPYSWAQAIGQVLRQDNADRGRAGLPEKPYRAPTWESHFNLVLKHFG